MFHLKRSRAFTLLELIVVIVILAILAALAIPTFSKVIDQSRDETTLASLQAIGREAQALRALSADAEWNAEDVEAAITDTPFLALSGTFAASMLTAEPGEAPKSDSPGEVVYYYIFNDSAHPNYAEFEGDLLLSTYTSTGKVAATLLAGEGVSQQAKIGTLSAGASAITLFTGDDSGTPGGGSAPPPATVTLAAPSSVKATVLSDSEIEVDWAPVSEADAYEVQRTVNSSAWETVAPAEAGTTFTDSAVVVDSAYNYRVKALAADATPSEYASAAEVTVQDPALWLTYSFSNASYRKQVLPISGNVDVDIDWGDGGAIQTDVTTDNVSHTFPAVGSYQVKISGTFDNLTKPSTNMATSAGILQSVDKWTNSTGTQSAKKAFYFSNLSTLDDSQVTLPSTVTDTSFMFEGSEKFNADLSEWDTSNVTNMSSMFSGAAAFNGDISTWDTGKVTDMSGMFMQGVYDGAFNQDLSQWDTSSVTTMASMFSRATAFNQDLSQWDTSSVTTMANMFYNARSFNSDLDWNTSQVKDMSQMFYLGGAFNGDVSDWDTSGVEKMNAMFYNATVFNQDISNWNTSKVTTMASMFYNADAFQAPIGNWDVSNVTTMQSMFYASEFNQPLNGWTTSSKLTNLGAMFMNNVHFNQPLDNWNTTGLTSMPNMFSGATSFNQDLSGWNVTLVNSAGKSNFDNGATSWQANFKPKFV